MDDKEKVVEEQNISYNYKQEDNIWYQYLSIDEKKASTLLICLVVCLLFAGVNYVRLGDITANLASIITALIYAIAGINATNVLGNYLSRGNANQSVGTNTMTGLNNQPSPKSNPK